ncbi:MAG: DUF1080 domain-containing protein [Candidatus Sumerlaeota bacterium]|nr:DUF1080 domain-containing protein [Candidatus Sumerlaeota bacterium]
MTNFIKIHVRKLALKRFQRANSAILIPAFGLAVIMVALLAAGLTGCHRENQKEKQSPPPKSDGKEAENAGKEPTPAVKSAKADDGDWESYFDGKTLKGWTVTDFGGQGKVHVKDGQIIMEEGTGAMTGINWTGSTPHINYEAEVEAMRADGSDFFCGFTFPIKDKCCSLICGGWGGTLVGISSLGGMDASENETTKMIEFENGRWYRIRVRVTEGRIRAWINDKDLVDVRPGTREISVRMEVEASQPFGVAAWHTKSALREIRVRTLSAEEVQEAAEEAKKAAQSGLE